MLSKLQNKTLCGLYSIEPSCSGHYNFAHVITIIILSDSRGAIKRGGEQRKANSEEEEQEK
jgi:hypothetical protein